MQYFVYAIIALIIFSFLFPKSRFLSILIFSAMWLLWGFNTMNGDYDNYDRFFDNSDITELTIYEPLYLLLNRLIQGFGFDFSAFMLIYSFIVLSLLLYFTSKSKYPALFSSLYFLNFIMEYVFMRNYLANALLLVAIVFCATSTKHKNIKIFILLLTASMFHVTSIMYLMFYAIVIRRISDKNLLLVPIVASFFVGFVFNFISLDPGKLGDKLSVYTDNATPTGPILMHLLIVVMSLIYFKFFNRNFRRFTSQSDTNFLLVLKRFNIISLAYIPAYIYIPYMTRFFRVLFPVNIFLGLLFFYVSRTYSQKIYAFFYVLVVFILMCYRFSTSTIDDTFIALFINNKIFTL